MTIHHDDGLPMFARGIVGPLGKLDVAEKTKIDEQTHDLWRQHCALRGTDTSTVLRDFIYATVYGKTYQQMVLDKVNHDAKRIETLARVIGSFGAPESNQGGPQA